MRPRSNWTETKGLQRVCCGVSGKKQAEDDRGRAAIPLL